VQEALQDAHLTPCDPDADVIVRSHLAGKGVSLAQIRSCLTRLSMREKEAAASEPLPLFAEDGNEWRKAGVR
jgi:hypothetical protein